MTEIVLSSRPAESDEDARKIARLLCEMYKEVGRLPVDANEAFKELYRIIKEEAAWLVEDQNGLEVATLGVQTVPGAWYSPDTPFLCETWFYILPGLRGGVARQLLEAELAAFCDATGLPAFIEYFDPSRLAEHGQRKVSVGEKNAYIPMGRICRVNPFGVPVVNEG